jgi:hypothetical protein
MVTPVIIIFNNDSKFFFQRLKWIPVRKWGLSKYDEDIKRLEETIFMYAKKNLAVVNVYIKVFGIYYSFCKNMISQK